MQTQFGIRTATVLGLALLWAAPAAAQHQHRNDHRDRGDVHHVRAHRHDDHGDRHARRGEHGHYRPVAFTHIVRGHPVRVVMHQPYYCAACRSHFRGETAFHDHLHRRHHLPRRSLWRHLVRVGWGWAYFG